MFNSIDIVGYFFQIVSLILLGFVIVKQYKEICDGKDLKLLKKLLFIITMTLMISIFVVLQFGCCSGVEVCSPWFSLSQLITMTAFRNFLISLSLFIIYFGKY